MPKLYVVSLSDAERLLLRQTVSRGVAKARTITRARILLKADEREDDGDTDEVIADTLEVSVRTIERLRQRAATEGIDAALHDRPRSGDPAYKLDGAQEARLTALACSQPPPGQTRWSMRLLAGEFSTRTDGVPVSRELVRRTLKKTNSSRI